jgi:sigma-B regulation protein RsbU (phosphoserine phosphatase)
MESEVRIARHIQESLLPRTFPPFPDHPELSLFASNIPAKEVAGDFYDFFFIDEERLVLTIADVSGKGIPAALFMAVCRTLLKDVCLEVDDPAIALARVNRALCQDNDACMFVTLYLAYYEVATGRLTFANAGHEEALLLDPSGSAKPFGRMGDIALGVVCDQSYRRGEVRLARGETLFLYTDGVHEAFSPAAEPYGRKRLGRLLSKAHHLPVEELAGAVLTDLATFQQDRQHDDITLLVLRRA